MREIVSAWHAFWNAVYDTRWGRVAMVALAPVYVVGALMAMAVAWGWIVSLIPGMD